MLFYGEERLEGYVVNLYCRFDFICDTKPTCAEYLYDFIAHVGRFAIYYGTFG